MTSTAPAYIGDRTFIAPEVCDAFFVLLDRLEAVVDKETAALRLHRHDDLAEHTRQKRQGLLEINRLVRSLDNTIPSQALITRLAAFRRKLEANDAALTIELRAAQAVTDTIVRVMRDLESDGTYSRAYLRDVDFE